MRWMTSISLVGKLLLLVLVPTVAFLFYLVSDLTHTFQQRETANETKVLTAFALDTGALLHEIQKERGFTCGYMGSGHVLFARQLADQRRLVDRMITRYYENLAFLITHHRSPSIWHAAEEIGKWLEELSFSRNEVDLQSISCTDAVRWYEKVSLSVIDFTHQLKVYVSHAGVNQALSIYELFLRYKDVVASERGLIIGILASNSTAITHYKQINEQMAIQRELLEAFNESATPEDREAYDQLSQFQSFGQVNEMEKEIIRAFEEDAESHRLTPAAWYQTMSQKIDLLQQLEFKLAARVLHQARNLGHEASLQMFWVTLFAVFLILALFVVSRVLIRDIMQTVLLNREQSVRLASQKQQLDTIFSSMVDGLLTIDHQGNITQANGAILKMCDTTESEILGKSVSCLFSLHHENDRSILPTRERMERIYDRNEGQFVQFIQQAPIPLLVLQFPEGRIHDEIILVNGRLLSLLGYHLDELQGKPVSLLLESHQWLQLHQWVQKREGTHSILTRWKARNGQMVKSFVNVEPVTWMAEPHLVLAVRTEGVMDRDLLKMTVFGQFLEGDSSHEIQKMLRGPDGTELPVLVSSAYLERRDKMSGSVLAVHDISDYLSAQEEKMANVAKDEFLASMSHELRTPLTSIIGNSELLASDEVDAERKMMIRSIQVSGQSQLALVNDILDLSKIGSGKFTIDETPFDLLGLIRDIEHMHALRANDSGIRFTIEQHFTETHQLMGDRQRIGQILTNLIGNAIKFTGSGGKVSLDVSVKAQRELVFTVTDSGIGMSPDTLGRLFQRFDQANETISTRFGGTGLGLFISRSLAELMKGTITVESEEGKGSSFSLIIPYQRSDLTVDGPNNRQGEEYGGDVVIHGHALLAEDTAELQFLICRMLKRLGLTVEVANNGKEAAERAMRQPFDIIFMDMQMPVMNGIEATRLLRAHRVLTPIIALTANAMQKHRDQFFEAGCNGFVAKPIDTGQLRRSVMDVLQVGSGMAHSPAPPEPEEEVDDELMSIFRGSAAAYKHQLEEALAHETWKQVKEVAHPIKGSGSSFGFPVLTEKARAVCDAYDNDQLDQLPELTQVLIVELDSILG